MAGAWLLVPGRRLRALALVALPPVLLWAAWGAFTAWRYGSVHFLGSTDVVFGRSWVPVEFWNQIVSTPVYYGAALVFPILLWAATLLRGRAGAELGVIGVLVGTAGVYWALPDGEPSRRAPLELEETVLAAVGFAGAFFLWCFLLARPRRLLEDPLDAFLALWLVGLLVFTALLNWHVNAADALLAAPPVLLLLFRDPRLAPSRPLVWAGAALMLPLSMGLAWADALQSSFYREAAVRSAAEIAGQPGRRWIVGHWGLQHYFEREGFEEVVPPMYGRSQLEPGDWVATARNVSQLDVSVNMDRYDIRQVWAWEKRHWLPLRTTNADASGGFYSHHSGYTPFSFSRLPFERVQLGRVVASRRGG